MVQNIIINDSIDFLQNINNTQGLIQQNSPTLSQKELDAICNSLRWIANELNSLDQNEVQRLKQHVFKLEDRIFYLEQNAFSKFMIDYNVMLKIKNLTIYISQHWKIISFLVSFVPFSWWLIKIFLKIS